MTISPAQCRAARGLLDWTQQRLADAANVGSATLRNFEAGRSTPQNATLNVLQRAFEAAGAEFTNGVQPGVKLTVAHGLAVMMREPLQANSSDWEALLKAAFEVVREIDRGNDSEVWLSQRLAQLLGPRLFVRDAIVRIVMEAKSLVAKSVQPVNNARKPPISDEAAIGDDPEGRGDPYTGSAK